MKTTYIIINLFLILNINSCLAQDNNSKKDTIIPKTNTMNRPQLNDSFEKLNLDDFKDGLVITKEKGTIEPYLGVIYDSYRYRKTDHTGYTTLDGTPSEGFGYSFTASNSAYRLWKSYYKNGFIDRKGIASTIDGQVLLGKEYRFNKNGQLEKVIDHDLGWDFPFEDVLQYILNRGLLIKYEEGYWSTEISKKESESEDCRKYWEVIVDTRKVTGKSTWEVIKLDAKTGEILYQIELEGDREWHADIENQAPKQKIIKEDRTTSKIYRTYKGKDYTYDQWLKFQEEFHEELKQNKK
ncbi:hypothetical protein FNW52_18100 [Flavobacterium sp. ZT3R18]|uniref:hypothetical protein n=1 Tax=Flavobacterium sp. ZT3R18 TaxID=2594429 RepID=UPI00117AE899|nr:hypothetical protein [Flavobacterium sp. ZT3R18]TRX31905.1 hypothetical protein FNW52_18100 [Flavobacterium sp. ZT3R18]